MLNTSRNECSHVFSIWLVDVADSLPSTVQLDGLDINLAQAPASGWLPKNIKLREWDMFSDPPTDLIGQYDIVHIRFITLVIKDNDAVPVIKNIRKLLSCLPSSMLRLPISLIASQRT